MKPKKIIPHILLAILGTMMFMSSCKKDNFGNNGEITFLTYDDYGFGSYIDVTVDGRNYGQVTHISFDTKCGKGDVNVKLPPGDYNFNAVSQNGTTWDGIITFELGVCKIFEFNPSNVGSGGGGGGSCNYSTYNGTHNCSSSGQVAVTNTVCCPTSTPYYCSITNQCANSCDAAKSVCGSSSIILGQNGGGGGGSCSSTNYTGSGSCSSGYVLASSGKCCPSSSPYYCASKNSCSSTCDGAASGCSGTVYKGTSQGGGGSTCASMNSYLTITQVAGCSSGTTDLKIKNNASVALYVKVCFLRVDTGNWDCYVDVSAPAGSTSTWGLISCSAKWTQYTVCTMKTSDWTGGCSSPVCHP